MTILLSSSLLLKAQETIQGSIEHDNLTRSYIVYVPAMYDESIATPLVLNFHGFGSNATQQMWYGDFRTIADTTGIIVVHPEGTLFQGSGHWNVGGFTTGSTIDDVGFTEELIDHLSSIYNIDPNRVYSTGMSNGGYMSFLLACQLGDKIAAIASVTGSMTPEIYESCDPKHPTPIMQIHGTTDPTVPYMGETWTKPISTVLEYWVNFNDCNPTPAIVQLPDLDATDGCTAENFVYSGGENTTKVEHYKIHGGLHTWPGSIFGSAGTNKDFNASKVIWDFFSRYSLDDLTGTSRWSQNQNKEQAISIYPNPAQNRLNIQKEMEGDIPYEIISLEGKISQSGVLNGKDQKVDISSLPEGIYILKAGNTRVKFLK